MRTRTPAVVTVLAAVALTSACGSPAPGDTTSAAGTTSASAASSSAATPGPGAAAGVLYLQRMAQFARQQTALADLARTRSRNDDNKALAAAMIADRRALLGDIGSALQAMGSALPAQGSRDGLGWPGMLSENQLRALTGAPDAEFDRLWPTAVTVTDREALTLTNAAAQGEGPAREIATKLIVKLSAESITANRLAGPAGTRAELPAT